MRPLLLPLRRLAPVLPLALAALACGSTIDDVCTDVGDCAQGGSSSWIDACESESSALQQESDSAGCKQQFDDYYACAKASFQCHGATAAFPGCDGALDALDRCLALSTSSTSCSRLQAAETRCAGDAGGDALADAEGDAGAPPPVLPAACTATRDCEAACYLAQVGDVCAPRIDELEAFQSCSASCP
jgi:hypothetical protein